MNVHALTRQFDDSPITAVEFDDQPCVIARELGAALGYADNGGKLTDRISGEWATEFEAGRHFHKVEGDELADLKVVLGLPPRNGGSRALGARARHLVLLTLPGIDLVLLKTEKPIGAKLRAWIVDEVFPALREHGAYELPRAPEAPSAAEGGALAEDHRVLRERRLARRERLAAAKEFVAVAGTWKGVTEEMLRPLLVSAYGEALEQDLRAVLAPAPRPSALAPAPRPSPPRRSVAPPAPRPASSGTPRHVEPPPAAPVALLPLPAPKVAPVAPVPTVPATEKAPPPAAGLHFGQWKLVVAIARELGATRGSVISAIKLLGLRGTPAYWKRESVRRGGAGNAKQADLYSPDAVALIEISLRERGFVG